MAISRTRSSEKAENYWPCLSQETRRRAAVRLDLPTLIAHISHDGERTATASFDLVRNFVGGSWVSHIIGDNIRSCNGEPMATAFRCQNLHQSRAQVDLRAEARLALPLRAIVSGLIIFRSRCFLTIMTSGGTGATALLGRLVSVSKVVCGVDQRDMGEGLRKVADQPLSCDIVLF
jgi:hypothetical protein